MCPLSPPNIRVWCSSWSVTRPPASLSATVLRATGRITETRTGTSWSSLVSIKTGRALRPPLTTRLSPSWQLPAVHHIIPRKQLHGLHQRCLCRCEYQGGAALLSYSLTVVVVPAGLHSPPGVHRDGVARGEHLQWPLVSRLRSRLLSCGRPLQPLTRGQQCQSSPACWGAGTLTLLLFSPILPSGQRIRSPRSTDRSSQWSMSLTITTPTSGMRRLWAALSCEHNTQT